MTKQLTSGDIRMRAESSDSQDWNTTIASLPGAHILQTWQWGQVKARYGWQPETRIWQDLDGKIVAAALVLVRALRIPGLPIQVRILYIPKGPLMDWGNVVLRRKVLADLEDLARKQGAIFIKIDPDIVVGKGIPGESDDWEDLIGQAAQADLLSSGWRFSGDQIQFRNTVLVDLNPGEENLLANMKQKTRYNIRLARRKGVSIRVGDQADLDALYRLYAETSLRDGFVIRDKNYYQTVWSAFIEAGLAQPLIADVDGEIIAALILFYFAGKAWYLYGMSSQAQRQKMPNYLLQWEAMRRAKDAGCEVYDLWGAPDEFDPGDSMWGVYRFKSGLGGQVVRHIGAWDLPVRPQLYRLYTRVLPRLLDLMRWRGKTSTRSMMN